MDFYVHHSRFSSGIFDETPGDFYNTTITMKFENKDAVPKIRHTFSLERSPFEHHVCGAICWGFMDSIEAYPLIKEDLYDGPDIVQYSYQGCRVIFGGLRHVLGPKFRVLSNPRTVEDHIQRIRIRFAKGGLFARVHDDEPDPYLSYLHELDSDKTDDLYRDPRNVGAIRNLSSYHTALKKEIERVSENYEDQMGIRKILCAMGYSNLKVDQYLLKHHDFKAVHQRLARLAS